MFGNLWLWFILHIFIAQTLRRLHLLEVVQLALITFPCYPRIGLCYIYKKLIVSDEEICFHQFFNSFSDWDLGTSTYIFLSEPNCFYSVCWIPDELQLGSLGHLINLFTISCYTRI